MDVNQTMRLGLKRQRIVKQKYFMCQYLDFQNMKFLEQNGSGEYQDLKVTENSRVCIKHFHSKDVLTEEVFPAHDGHP